MVARGGGRGWGKWVKVLLPRKSHGRRSLVSRGSQRVGHDGVTSLSLVNSYPFPVKDKQVLKM